MFQGRRRKVPLFGIGVLSIAIFCLKFNCSLSSSDRLGNFFQIEVNFTRFENKGGVTYQGSYCDSMSACDPQTYAVIDLIFPQSSYSAPKKKAEDFVLVHSQCCADVYNMTSNNQIVKTICQLGRHPLPTDVNVRVEVRDKDIFTPDDIIEQFDCKFRFRPGVRHPENWSNEAECRALHGMHRIKLYYRQRIYPIFSTECYVPF